MAFSAETERENYYNSNAIRADQPTSGQIELFGENLFKNQKGILRRIGSIVEVPGFYENLTARENLLINAKIIGVHKKNAIEEALEIVDLHHETKKNLSANIL